MKKNICLLTDSYKATHAKQYPPGTENVYSYFESRGGQFPETVFFGLQYFLKEYLYEPVNMAHIKQAAQVWKAHFGQDLFNEEGWKRLVVKHGGFLPLSIKAVPEGTVVDTHNVLMTVENTDPEFYWLTNYLETLLVQVWYPTTVATLSRAMRQMLLRFLEETGDPGLINFKLHDFGFRGVSSVESAAIGGAAHLVNFMGTDTIVATRLVDEYYGGVPEGIAGFSIPASEHSTITSWGKEGEVEAFRNMLEQYPTGLVACVSDSFDIFNACSNLWGSKLRERVLGREGTLVVRPDSGNPADTVLSVLNLLGDKFGYAKNAKGFNVLDPHVRVIQGDGVDYDSVGEILRRMRLAGWSADNIAFGMGGALLQKLNRDTQKFAFKCSSVVVNGEQRDVWKDPVTDQGKRSKKGRLALYQHTGWDDSPCCWSTDAPDSSLDDQLVEVYRDGQILKQYDFAEIRGRAQK